MNLVIDSREQDRIKSATKYYTNELKLEVNVEELPVGDYIFTDSENSVCFEFKEINDFITSISNHRVFNQAINMAEEFDYHFVVIRGTESERAKYLAISKNYQTVTVYQYLGAIASLNRYTTVLEVYTPYINEAYYRMYIQAKKCLQNRPIVKKFPRKHKNPVLNFLCHDIYGINYTRAKLIVDEYNLKSIDDLKQLSVDDLCLIDGIGENIAEKIKEATG